MRDIILTILTNGSGAATVTSTEAVNGYVEKIRWVGSGFSATVDAVLTVTGTPEGVDETLLTLTDKDDDLTIYPRYAVQGDTGADLTLTTGSDAFRALVVGKLKVVVAAGGDSLTGSMHVYIDECDEN